ncbi:putative dioxygenase [Fasciolopsis buskii]|uniref:Putative dioxygenase n=1 Tax=Fasciolopsis buskii TaxID=27845 RepID=A0A8E0VGC7_9TREM|nr:putative dioxygenase [Fasciolopsis buski]KAA0186435.1 putative dioxygenase [Fasciolopsis buski]
MVVGNLSPEREAVYGRILAPYLANSSNVFVISSDFCHWGRRFRYQYYDKQDGDIWQSIEKLDHMVSHFFISIWNNNIRTEILPTRVFLISCCLPVFLDAKVLCVRLSSFQSPPNVIVCAYYFSFFVSLFMGASRTVSFSPLYFYSQIFSFFLDW